MRTRVIVGVGAIVGVLAAAGVAPQTVGLVLIWFSFLVGLIAFLGFIDPGTFGFPDRQAPVWLVAASIGLFIGGGVILAPPGEIVVSSDMTSEERAARYNRQASRVLRRVAECLDGSRSSIANAATFMDPEAAGYRIGIIIESCGLVPPRGLTSDQFRRLSPEAAQEASRAVAMINIGGLWRPYHPIGTPGAINHAVAGLNRHADRLASVPRYPVNPGPRRSSS